MNPCSEVRFDQAEINASQLKALVACLNQKNEIPQIETWVNSFPDEGWNEWLIPVNKTMLQEPLLLYSLRDTYLREKASGRMTDFFKNLFNKLNPKANQRLSEILNKHQKWISKLVSNQEYSIRYENTVDLTRLSSFQRLLEENYPNGNLEKVFTAISQYRHSQDSLTVENIFGLFSDFKKDSLSDPETAERFSQWINWLMNDKKLNLISNAANLLQRSPIQCFNGAKTLQNPLDHLLSELSEMNPQDGKDFFEKTLPSLIFSARGYCEISNDLLDAAKLLQFASQQDGFMEFFSAIQPLLKKENFKTLLLSRSFVQLSEDLSFLNRTHFFQDILPIVLWVQERPLIQGNSASLTDSVLLEFKDGEINFLLSLFPENKGFYETLFLFWEKLSESQLSFPQENWINPFTLTTFSPVIDLAKEMHTQEKLLPLMDDFLDLFKNLIDRAKPKITKKPRSTDRPLSPLAFWKLEGLGPSGLPILSTPCLAVDFHFNPLKDILLLDSSEYWKKIENLSACFGTNRSFGAVKDFLHFALFEKKDPVLLKKILNVQNDFAEMLFSLPSGAALDLMESWIDLSEPDLKNVQDLMQSSSKILQAAGSSMKNSGKIRNLISDEVRNPGFFHAFTELIGSESSSADSSTLLPEEDLRTKLIFIAKQSIPELFKAYCTDLDPSSPHCQIEADQVALYKKSVTLLAEKMADEYLSSSQTWIHPREFNTWTLHQNQPKKVSELNYHLNPLLKQFKNHPKAVQGIFDFVRQNQNSKVKLLDFLEHKAKIFSVIPYLYQQGDYPETQREFKDLIRLKLISEIDRIELLAINSDFMPFGVMKNFGMSFIHEIALAWGDLPSSERPADSTAVTLSEAKESILNQYAKFNLGWIQKWGNCDGRGKGRIKNWLNKSLCKGELGDVRARMFNLNQTLSVMDDPHTLELLRDLFYSLYSSNDSDRFGYFSNGLNLKPSCLSPDLQTTGQDEACVFDLLQAIPQIARTGIFHQASLSLAKGKTQAVFSLIKLLQDSVQLNSSQALVPFLSKKEGLTFLIDTVDLLMKSEESSVPNLVALTRNLSELKNHGWVYLLINLVKADPGLISDYDPVLRRLFERIKIKAPLSMESNEYFSSFSQKWSHQDVAKEFSNILFSMKPVQREWLKVLEFEFSKKIRMNGSDFGDSNQSLFRLRLSQFIQGEGFNDFCDVFNDSLLTNRAYKILENSNQNYGVEKWLGQARLFLH